MLVIAIGLAGWLILSRKAGYGSMTLQNEGYSYSFNFDTSAKQITSEGSNFLSGRQANSSTEIGVTGKPTTSPVITACSRVGSTWTDAFSVTIDGTSYKVCTTNKVIYATTITADSRQHLVEVISNDRQTSLDEDSAKAIIESVKVTK